MSGTITENSSSAACGLRRSDGLMLSVGADGLMLGRTAAQPGRLKDPLISARHARLLRTPLALQIEDLGSTNGTWVNGQRVVVQSLRDGDTLRLGRTLLVAVVPEPACAAGFANAETCLQLIARWERLRARAPRENYLDWLVRTTGVARMRLDAVRRVRNLIAHADGPVRSQRIASALRLISEAERALEK